MSYWEDIERATIGMSIPEAKAFWSGVKEGIHAYAVWKDGEQLVGIMERPLKEVFQEIDKIIGAIM